MSEIGLTQATPDRRNSQADVQSCAGSPAVRGVSLIPWLIAALLALPVAVGLAGALLPAVWIPACARGKCRLAGRLPRLLRGARHRHLNRPVAGVGAGHHGRVAGRCRVVSCRFFRHARLPRRPAGSGAAACRAARGRGLRPPVPDRAFGSDFPDRRAGHRHEQTAGFVDRRRPVGSVDDGGARRQGDAVPAARRLCRAAAGRSRRTGCGLPDRSATAGSQAS